MSISQAYTNLLPPEAATDLKTRFQEFYAALAERAAPMLGGPERSSWKQLLDLEHDNLIAALELAVEQGNGTTALRLAASLWPYWDIRANWQEGLRLTEEALSQDQAVDAKLIARATLGKGILMQREVSGSGIPFIKEAYDVAASAGDLTTAADALSLFAISTAYAAEGFEEAARTGDEAIEIAKRSGDQRVLAAALHRRGAISSGQGEDDRAKAFAEEALEIRREIGDLDGQRESLTLLAWIHYSVSREVEARRYMEEGLKVARDLGDQLKLASILVESGWIIDVEPGDEMRAFEEALTITRRHGNPTQIGNSLMYLGWRAYMGGDFKRARECFEEGVELYRGKDPASYANALSSVAWVDFSEGQGDLGLQRSRDALAVCRTGSNKHLLAWQIAYHGDLLTASGDPVEGLAHLREAEQLFEGLQDEVSLPELILSIARALVRLGDLDGALAQYEVATLAPRFAPAAHLGIASILVEKGSLEEASLSIKKAVELGSKSPTRISSFAARGLEEMALVKLAQGEAELGARILGAAAELRGRRRQPVDPVRHGNRYDAIVQKVKDALGHQLYEREFTAGRALTEKEAFELSWGHES